MDWITDVINDRPDTTVASRTTFDDPRGVSPSIAIATALATLEDAPPCRADFTLTDGIDPDALDDLVTDDVHDAMVAFTMDDYVVVAQSNGRVEIRASEE